MKKRIKRWLRKETVKIDLKAKKKWCIIYLIFLLFVLGVLFFIYKDYIGPFINSPRVLYQKDVSGEKIVLSGDTIYKEEIRIESNGSKGIGIAFDADATDPSAILCITIRDRAGKDINSWTVTKNEFVNGYTVFSLETGQLKKNEMYFLEISLQQGNQGSFYCSNENTLAYQIVGETSNSLLYMYGFLVICILIFVFGIFIAVMKELSLEKSFVVMSVLLGLIYIVLIPPYFTPDEEYHFAVSYAASSRILNEPVVNEEGNVLVRETDYNYYQAYLDSGGNELSRNSYIAEIEGIFSDNSETLSEQYHIRKLPNKTALIYIPQIVGVTLARILNLNGALLFLLGRATTFVTYLLLMGGAIKLMPYAKLVMITIGCFPMMLELGTSYNYDAILLPTCFFTIAYIFHLAYKAEKVRKRDFAVLALMLSIICLIKAVYAVIFLLALIIPKEKFGSGKMKLIMAIGMICIGFFVLGFTNVSSTIGAVSENSEEIATWSGEKNYSIQSICNDPLHILGVFFRTFYRNADYYIGSAIGRNLGWLNFGITPLIFSGYIVLLFVSVLKKEDKPLMKTSEKVISLVYCAVVTGLVYISLLLSWTRETSQLVEGIQGRYFLPVFPVLFCTFQNKTIVIKREISKEVLTGLAFISVFSVLSIFENAII